MPVSADIVQKLKTPFGLLIPDREVTEQRIRDAIKGSGMVVTVGDATTERLLSFLIIPDVAVIDGIERRSRRAPLPVNYSAIELRCANPSGSISKNAFDVLQLAIKGSHPARVIVDGEEDLLALPLFYLVSQDSVVLYGQPLEGLVVVRITAAKKKEAKDLMDRIGII